jgi:XTP/dITP diphosphohydrolase
MNLVFCTNNAHKITEVQAILGNNFQFQTLQDIRFTEDIPEDFETLEENSLSKAMQVWQKTGLDCFAEDTGLFVDALQGEPGVYSARYAGEKATAAQNISLLLQRMEGKLDRNAFFKTIITLLINGKATQFTGVCHGQITTGLHGQEGFGYDPVFIPNGYSETFAALPPEIKNSISHRRKAFEEMASFLSGQNLS